VSGHKIHHRYFDFLFLRQVWNTSLFLWSHYVNYAFYGHRKSVLTIFLGVRVFVTGRSHSLAKNLVRMRSAKSQVSGFQRCNWFRSENARENRTGRRSDGCRVMVIAKWLFSHLREIETRFVLVIKWVIF